MSLPRFGDEGNPACRATVGRPGWPPARGARRNISFAADGLPARSGGSRGAWNSSAPPLSGAARQLYLGSSATDRSTGLEIVLSTGDRLSASFASSASFSAGASDFTRSLIWTSL